MNQELADSKQRSMEAANSTWDGWEKLNCERMTGGVFGRALQSASIGLANRNGVFHWGCEDRGASVGLLPCVVDAECPACGRKIVEQVLDADAKSLFDGELFDCLKRVEMIGNSEVPHGKWKGWNWFQWHEWRAIPSSCANWSRLRRFAATCRNGNGGEA